MGKRRTGVWGAVGLSAAMFAAVLSPASPALAAGTSVANVAELKTAVEALPAGAATIELANGFAPVGAPPTITVPDGVDLTLAGAGTTVTKADGTTGRHLDLVGNGSQTMTVTGIDFVGFNDPDPAGQAGGVPGGGLGLQNFAKVVVMEATFAGIDSSAGLALGGVKRLEVSDASFLGNRAAAGAAVELPVGIDATFTRTTMHKNWGTQPGYSGGALRAMGKSTLTVENSVFTGNVSLTRGGAIAFHQMDGALTVRDSVFTGNRVPLAANNTTVNDGGAIAVNERPIAGAQTGKTRITGSTFSENVAADEGGALLIQSGNGSSAVIQNSTFYANRAEGKQVSFDDTSGGGAIEAFGTPLTLEHNTFVNNLAHKGTSFFGHQRGGAVSTTGDTAHLTAQPLTLSHNLFVGNDVVTNDGVSAPSSLYRQVSARGGIETPEALADPTIAVDESPDAPDLTSDDAELQYPVRTQHPADGDETDFVPLVEVDERKNVGVDNGTAIDYDAVSRLAVLGDDAASPAANGSTVIAGDARTGTAQTPGTIRFLPEDAPFLVGLADGAAGDPAAAAGVSQDQRGFPVDEPADAGALQQAFIRYDPNGGDWEALVERPFDGARIVLRDETALVWAVGPVGSEISTEPAPTTAPEGKVFAGWNTAADGSGTAFPAGTIAIPPGNLRVFAQWDTETPPVKDGTVTVEYVDADGAPLRDPIVLTGKVGDPYTTEQVVFEGYDLLRIEGVPNGTYGDEAVIVRYHYRAQDIPPPTGTGTVVTAYVDDAGKALRSPITQTGKIGEKYQTKRLSFSGYSFARVDGKATGTYAQTPIAVTYVYQQDGAVTPPPVVDPPEGKTPPATVTGPLATTGLNLGWPLAAATGVAMVVAAGVFLLGRRRLGEGDPTE
ncbi:MucBP domain-containing protein [Leucobacter chromiireducens]|uniref:MucBP domain-containing protein n=1 Tax=Leucobacter chromiireducens subsp. solipictus TaxID=398235 RepID=A0ABS1SGJ5_9MICO|nr:MucBP domain-containing protein [Leucobacter chromiireducens]MBL3679660.1 hypothetical protein [Leucobacter chromiireducens subsp. solipictus]